MTTTHVNPIVSEGFPSEASDRPAWQVTLDDETRFTAYPPTSPLRRIAASDGNLVRDRWYVAAVSYVNEQAAWGEGATLFEAVENAAESIDYEGLLGHVLAALATGLG